MSFALCLRLRPSLSPLRGRWRDRRKKRTRYQATSGPTRSDALGSNGSELVTVHDLIADPQVDTGPLAAQGDYDVLLWLFKRARDEGGAGEGATAADPKEESER